MKRCLNTRLFALPVIAVLLLLAGCQAAPTSAPATATPLPPTPTTEPSPSPVASSEPVFTVVNLDGKSQDFTLDELKALPASEGLAGMMSSTGKITPPTAFSGVLLTDVLEAAGGVDESMGIQIEASDGYAMTFSAAQVLDGDFITYDAGTGEEVKEHGDLRVLLAYAMDGAPLDAQRDGVLRLVILNNDKTQVTDGHWSIKWVRTATLKPLAVEWELVLEGALDETIDRGAFESCGNSTCHAAAWKDDKAQTWSGTPLWALVGRVDDDVRHDDDAFNDALAEAGYTVEVVGADGYSATFASAELMGNDEIIVANLANGNPLTEEDFPLSLVGPDVNKKQAVGGITKIIVHAPQAGEAGETGPTPEGEAVAPAVEQPPVSELAVLPEGKNLMISGMVGEEVAWSLEELRAMTVIKETVEHPKKGKQDVEGVSLNALINAARLKLGAKTVVFTAADGFSASADLEAVRKCTTCLVAFNESGGIKLVMPGMDSGLWVKDITSILVQ